MENKDLREEVEIDLSEIVKVLLGKLHFILLAGVICAVLAGFYTKVFVTPLYQSETSLYVLSDTEKDNLTNSDLAKNTLLTKDYAELIKSRTVINEVIRTNGLKMDEAEMNKKVNVVIKNDTRVMTIKVTDKNPKLAQQLANSVCAEGSQRIKDVMNAENVKVVDKANLPEKPISPNVKRNVLAAAVLGAFVVIVIVVVKHLMDDTIKTTDDVETYLGLSVLGAVPFDEDLSKQRKKVGRKERKANRRTSPKPKAAPVKEAKEITDVKTTTEEIPTSRRKRGK